MSTFEHLIERQPRDLVEPKHDPTILLVKQRRASHAMGLREQCGITADQAYLETHRLSLVQLGLKPSEITHINGLTTQNSQRSDEEIASIQGKTGLFGESLDLPVAN